MNKAARSSASISSPLLWMLPAMSGFVALAFAYLNIVVIGEERRVHDTGERVEARVVRLWQEEDHVSKSTKRKLSHVHLAWRGRSGADMEFHKLSIAGKTYAALRAAEAQGIKTTPILYDPTGRDGTPFLVADGEERTAQWALARNVMWVFAGLTLILSWLIARRRG